MGDGLIQDPHFVRPLHGKATIREATNDYHDQTTTKTGIPTSSFISHVRTDLGRSPLPKQTTGFPYRVFDCDRLQAHKVQQMSSHPISYLRMFRFLGQQLTILFRNLAEAVLHNPVCVIMPKKG